MAKLPSIQGLRDNKAITVAFEEPLFQLIEQQCRAEWLELHRIDHPNETASPFVPYNKYIGTEEGRIHLYLLGRAFYVTNTKHDATRKPYAKGLSMSEYGMVSSRLQAQRYTTQGTRKRFDKRVHAATAYRKFRNWWINKHYAAAVGLELNVECPFDKYVHGGPTVSYIEMGNHFEEWTGYKLPKELWAELREDEAKRVAQEQKELQAA